MSAWQACAGATVLVPSGPQGQHLFVVLNDPQEFDGYGKVVCVVMIPLDSVKTGIHHDSTCELAVGVHPFVTRPTFVNFRLARIEQARHLEAMVNTQDFQTRAPVDTLTLERIRQGLVVSPFTTREIKRLFR